ncbi:MAG: barstar family protein [Nocardioides sp.]
MSAPGRPGMSGLAAVLAGTRAAGVYRWRAAIEVDDIARAVEQAGWQFGYLDGWQAQTMHKFLRAAGVALAFPEYYGRNLDALADGLRDTPADPAARVLLLWDGWAPLARADESGFDRVLAVFRNRIAVADGRFAVLLRGAGPALGEVSSLD